MFRLRPCKGLQPAWLAAACAGVAATLLYVYRPGPLTNGPNAGEARHNAAQPLFVVPTHIDLGTIRKGGRAQVRFRLENCGHAAVGLGRLGTSCECFHVVLEKRTIAPGESLWAKGIVDFAPDPTATGCFRLEATGGAGRAGTPAFSFYVDVRVK